MFYQYANANLYYETIGEGKPVIILHGLGGNGAFMKECLEPIFVAQTKYQRIYIDMPGMGKSDFGLEYACANRILEVLLSFIKDHVNQSFLLVGQSYGGYIARGLIPHFKNTIDGLMLLCPVIIPEPQKRSVPTIYPRFLNHAFLNQLPKEQRDMFLEYAIIGNEEVYLRYKKAVALALEETNQEFIDLLVQNYAFSFDIDKIIRDISFEKPSLFLCGRQDNCVGYKDIWNLIDEYPRATLSILDKAGHNLQIEQPHLFNHLVSNWLLKIENDD